MKLVLIRHGQPAWQHNGITNVHPPLSPTGYEQAHHLAAYWADKLKGASLFVSPMLRAQETIAPLASALGKGTITLDWLAEIGLVEAWHGTPAGVMTNAMISHGMSTREHWFAGIEGGEANVEFNRRVRTGLEAFLGDHEVVRHPGDPEHLWDTPDTWDKDRVFVMVAHVGTIGVILSHLLPAIEEPWEWERFACGHTGVSVIGTKALSTAHIWQLTRFNDRTHLGGDAI